MLRFLKGKESGIDTANNDIGSILVGMGLLTKDQLVDIVADFRASEDELLGQFIVRKTTITENQIELALLKQRVMCGGGNQKVFDRLMEISKRSGDSVSTKIDELTIVANQVVNDH